MSVKITIQEILKKEKDLESQLEKCLSSKEFEKIYPYLYAIKEIRLGTYTNPYNRGLIPIMEYFDNNSNGISLRLIKSIKPKIEYIRKKMYIIWPHLENINIKRRF